MTPFAILERVSKARGVSISRIRGRGRTKRLARARHEAAYLLRQHTPMSLNEVGAFLGNLHHTSVINAVRVIEALVWSDQAYSDELEAILGPVTFAEALAREAA